MFIIASVMYFAGMAYCLTHPENLSNSEIVLTVFVSAMYAIYFTICTRSKKDK